MYNAILKWSLNQADGFDDSGATMEPMSQERKDFLQRAMKQYIVNETERINDIVEILKFAPPPAAEASSGDNAAAAPDSASTSTPGANANYTDVIKAAVDIKVDGGEPDISAMLRAVPPSALVDMKLEALEELRDRVEQVDNASFFACNCNGKGELELVLDLLVNHPSGKVRVAAGQVLSTVLQNNPVAQARAQDIPQFMQTLFAIARGRGVPGASTPEAATLASGESPEEQQALEQDLRTAAFGVLSSFIRGANASARLAHFLSTSVGGPEFLADVLASTLTDHWQRYTPRGTSKPRKGWWRKLPAGTPVPRGSEVALDLTDGSQYLKYAGEGDPDHRGINTRLLSKVVFFVQYVLREISASKDGDRAMATLLHRLRLAGDAGASLAALAADTNPDAAASSEGAATTLLLALQVPETAAGASTSSAPKKRQSAAAPATPAAAQAVSASSSGGGGSSSNNSSVIMNGGGTAIVSVPEGWANASESAPAVAASSAAQVGTVSDFKAAVRRSLGPAIRTACEEQEKALVASAGGDEEQLSYLEEPRALFKSLLKAVEQ